MNCKRGILFTLILVVLAAFPWGPLFAWSPVHPGYNKLELSRADVLYPNDVPLDPEYRDVDKYLATAENFHELKCPKRIKIVVCRDWNDCMRFAAPVLIGQRPLAVTIATGTVTFVTPRAATTETDIGGLLRHELSHAVLSQNRSLWSVWRMLRQPWVSEGIAGVVSGQGQIAPGRYLATMPEALFLSQARTVDLWPSFSPGSATQTAWFRYTVWLYFWDRQIDRGGKETFLRFERACFSNPDGCRSIFAEVYGMDLRKAVEEFQAEVRSGRLVPPDRIG